ALQPGSDGDIVLFNPKKEWTITSSSQHSAAGYTPYNGTRVIGKAVMTIRRGEILTDGETYLGKPGTGSFISAGKPGIYQD
nr:dihydropyrimidinase [Spirochaetales bacterium]